MTKKLLSVLFSVLMILAVFTSCDKSDLNDDSDVNKENIIDASQKEDTESSKTDEEPVINYYETVVSEFDSLSGDWLSNGVFSVQNENSPTGTGYFEVSALGDTVLLKSFNEIPLDLSVYKDNGVLHLWLYIENASEIYGGQIELTSSFGSDSLEYHWGELGTTIVLQNGWNELNLPLSEVIEQNGPADWGNINYMRIYVNSASEVKLGLDDMYVYMNTEERIVDVSFSVDGSTYSMNCLTGSQISIEDISSNFAVEGKDIVGWIVGDKTYNLSDSVVIDEDMVFTAMLEPWPKYKVIYSDGTDAVEGEEVYEGVVVKLAPCTFEKVGYTFAGWQDSFGKVYKSGHSYVVNAEDNKLVAVWKEISDYDLLKDAQEAWELCEGGVSPVAYSAIGRTDAELKWTVWLNSETFGQTLDFSTEGAVMAAQSTAVDLSGDFSISAWIKAPKRENTIRTIVASGSTWSVFLDENGILSFNSEALNGIEASGVGLVDGKWHHVLISRDADNLMYYVDGSLVKKITVQGTVLSDGFVSVGALADGSNWFDGSISQVRIYGKAKTPSEVTNVNVVASDNEVKEAVFSYFNGITTDRSQGFGTKGGTLLADDVLNCKKMGFEFIRMMIYVDNLVGEGGKLNEEYIVWAVDFINTIVDNGMPCMISLGCGNRDVWNGKYLGTPEGFEELVVFYGELAEWIKAQGWASDEVSLLMFTEPVNMSSTMDWTWMSDRLCAAVRNVDSEITIITSSEDTGNIEYIKEMSPVTDDNVVYSFTSYEPYTVGFNSFNDFGVADSWWHYVQDIPYPIEEGVDYTDAIEAAIINVPEEQKATARATLKRYVLGRKDAWRLNPYKDTLYNAEWLMLRASSLNDWSEKYGGGIHLFVAEFGACDSVANINLGAKIGSGLSETTRLRLINDSIKAYNAYNIGWSFWQYNESFTVYNPQVRQPGACVTEEMFSSYVYKDLLDALELDYNEALIK